MNSSPPRQCGDCQLCCKLMPMAETGKPANQRCEHQKFGVGCKIYAHRPLSCQFWTCRWLANDDTALMRRPDRAHYVIDVMPDFVTLAYEDGTPPRHIQVVQIWVDPNYPDAHRDPALRAYLERRGREGTMALIRNGSKKAFTLVPPSMADDHKWHEVGGNPTGEHSVFDVASALGGIEVEAHKS